jgi:DNA-binding XRE family transcriptional regulator
MRKLKLACLLKERLREAGLAPYCLSKETGIPAASIRNWIRGRTQPILSSALRIANHLGCRVEDIWFMIPDAPKDHVEDIEANLWGWEDEN